MISLIHQDSSITIDHSWYPWATRPFKPRRCSSSSSLSPRSKPSICLGSQRTVGSNGHFFIGKVWKHTKTWLKIPENPMKIPWKSHEDPMKIPWRSHEDPMKIPWIHGCFNPWKTWSVSVFEIWCAKWLGHWYDTTSGASGNGVYLLKKTQ